MRLAIIAALAASTLVSAPAIAQNGNAYGHDPKVCLVTFGSPAERAGQADADVVKAQYLPVRIAMKHDAR